MHRTFNYVISLTSATQRREHITNEFSRQNIPFVFFDAVNWKETPSHPYLSQKLNKLLSQTDKLSEGEKGCLASHLALWQKCIDLNLPYICIFEDDVILSQRANQFLINDNWLKERFDLNEPFILRFETFLFPVEIHNTKIVDYLNYAFKELNSNDYGTAGYLISKNAAKELLFYISNFIAEELVPVDELIFNYFINKQTNKQTISVYQLSPAICIQELQINAENAILPSQLNEMREQRWKAEKSSRKIKLKKMSVKELIYHLLTKPQRMLKKRQLKIEQRKAEEKRVVVRFE